MYSLPQLKLKLRKKENIVQRKTCPMMEHKADFSIWILVQNSILFLDKVQCATEEV